MRKKTTQELLAICLGKRTTHELMSEGHPYSQPALTYRCRCQLCLFRTAYFQIPYIDLKVESIETKKNGFGTGEEMEQREKSRSQGVEKKTVGQKRKNDGQKGKKEGSVNDGLEPASSIAILPDVTDGHHHGELMSVGTLLDPKGPTRVTSGACA